jgi:hypothetical protein
MERAGVDEDEAGDLVHRTRVRVTVHHDRGGGLAQRSNCGVGREGRGVGLDVDTRHVVLAETMTEQQRTERRLEGARRGQRREERARLGIERVGQRGVRQRPHAPFQDPTVVVAAHRQHVVVAQQSTAAVRIALSVDDVSHRKDAVDALAPEVREGGFELLVFRVDVADHGEASQGLHALQCCTAELGARIARGMLASNAEDEAVRTGERRPGGVSRDTFVCGMTALSCFALLAGCHGPTVGQEVEPADTAVQPSDATDGTITPDADSGLDTAVVTDTAIAIDTADAGDPCIDPTGFGGRGCRKCPPVTQADLQNACTTSDFLPFDDARLPLDGGGLPPLPGDAGADAPAETATPDSSTDSSTDTAPDAADATTDSSDAAADATSDTADAAPPLPRCSTLSGGNVIYLTGASAVTFFIGYLAQALENTAVPLSVVYVTQGSCNGVGAMLNPTTGVLKGVADYWTADTAIDPGLPAARLQCQLEAGGVPPDVGISDVFASSCFDLPSGLPAGLASFNGPVQVMGFVVPEISTERVISSEAAYLVYGFGTKSYPVMPWVDLLQLFTRFPTSGPQTLIGAQIGLPPPLWQGQLKTGSEPMRDALIAANAAGPTIANKTIGILSGTYADDERDKLSFLAFRDRGQKVAFFPDSKHDLFDRKNARDGHYSLWSPLSMLARVDGSGRPSANVQRFINVVNGVETLPGVEIISLYADRHIIPTCAMTVTREADGGPIRPLKPAKGCGCYYEEKANKAKTATCTTCTTNIDCPVAAPNCNKFGGSASGYCEP